MKKGDLVKKRENPEYWVPYIPEFISGIVITEPYAAVFTQQQEDGSPVFSMEKIVVDILYENRVIQKCPIDAIIKM